MPHDNDLRIEDFKQVNFRELIENKNKLVHTFGALAELGHEVATRSNFQETIRTSLHLILGSLGIMRGGVARYSRFEHELNMLAVRGLGDAFPLSLDLCHEDERQFLTNGLVPIEIEQAAVLPFFQVYDRTFDASGLSYFSVVIRDETVGAIFLGEKATGDSYSSTTKRSFAPWAAISEVRSPAQPHGGARTPLGREQKALRWPQNDLCRYGKAFAAAIDCKDKYTEGHSVRVGRYSEIIGTELGWEADEIEGAAVAGYLHDVGKLTVDRKIINAPYRINAKESAELNKHPAVGYEILAPSIIHIRTYRLLQIPSRTAGWARLPDGFTTADTYIAKVVNLADSFDAMTTDRPYRRVGAMRCLTTFSERGQTVRPEIVAAFSGEC
jgi:HD-GYP domain-containing protein (c-di-GMP phosphodiesterase class II)